MLVHAPSPRRAPVRPQILFLAALFFSVSWALTCNFMIGFLQAGSQEGRVVRVALSTNLVLFGLSALVVWIVIVLLWAASGRLAVALAISGTLTVLVSWINSKKLEIREEPIYPSDFDFLRDTAFLSDMISPAELFGLVGAAMVAASTPLLFGRLLKRQLRLPHLSRPALSRLRVIRVLTCIICLLLLGYASTFNASGNRLRAAYEAAGAHWKFWSQEFNYQYNGFVPGFLYNFPGPAMRAPPAYSQEKMREIAARYASPGTGDLDGAAVEDVNVVLILSEAFVDPEDLRGISFAVDPIPRVRSIMNATLSGNMLAQLFAGGTANMEFEVLSGLSTSQYLPQLNSPYQQLVPNQDFFPSAVYYFKKLGHSTIAIHPYSKSMYKREQVYPILGFDSFIGEDDMHFVDRVGTSEFVSDSAAFTEVLRQLTESRKPALVNVVTMQNHYPMKEAYPDPIPVEGTRTEEEAAQAAGYARGLAHTDEAIAAFLSSLEGLSEKTAVIFYGDHQPGFWSQQTREENGTRAMRRTPFFMWTNFAELESAPQPRFTSPVFFLPILLESLGAPAPAFYNLMAALHDELPALDRRQYLNAKGRFVAEGALSARAKRLLRDYRYVQYDLSVGQRYSLRAMYSQPD